MKRLTIILLFFVAFWVFFGYAFYSVMRFDYLMAGFSFACGMMGVVYLIHWKDEKE